MLKACLTAKDCRHVTLPGPADSVCASLLLLTLGFGLRERDVGVLMMWVGTLGIFGLTCWKILEKLPS
jgi:hypothetical protein